MVNLIDPLNKGIGATVIERHAENFTIIGRIYY